MTHSQYMNTLSRLLNSYGAYAPVAAIVPTQQAVHEDTFTVYMKLPGARKSARLQGPLAAHSAVLRDIQQNGLAATFSLET